MANAPYNPRRQVIQTIGWPFGRCKTCCKDTMLDCDVCGQCAEEYSQRKRP